MLVHNHCLWKVCIIYTLVVPFAKEVVQANIVQKFSVHIQQTMQRSIALFPSFSNMTGPSVENTQYFCQWVQKWRAILKTDSEQFDIRFEILYMCCFKQGWWRRRGEDKQKYIGQNTTVSCFILFAVQAYVDHKANVRAIKTPHLCLQDIHPLCFCLGIYL